MVPLGKPERPLVATLSTHRPPCLRNCIMLLKSLAVSVAAALLGPTLGIAMFFLADSNSASGQQLITATQHEVVGSFAPSETWYGPSAQAGEMLAAAAEL